MLANFLYLVVLVSNIAEAIKVDDGSIEPYSTLSDLPDQIIADLHAEMREALELRQRRYPNSRELIDVDMRKQLLVEKGGGNVIFGFGWKDGKFVRCYHPTHYTFSKGFNNITDTDKMNTDIYNVKLYNRYKARTAKPAQMQCMLYASISAVQYIIFLKRIEFRVTFRSGCMPTTVTRVFTVAEVEPSNMPLVVELKVDKRAFVFEFDNKKAVYGSGPDAREGYNNYKLLNYYKSFVNYMKSPKLANVNQAMATYERSQKTNEEKEKIQNAKQAKLDAEGEGDAERLLSLSSSSRTETGPGMSYKKFRKLYRDYNMDWLAYKRVGNSEIMSMENNKKPYFPHATLTTIWGGNNPTSCTIGVKTGNYRVSWETKYVQTYGQIPGTNTYGEYNQPTRTPVYASQEYYRMTCNAL